MNNLENFDNMTKQQILDMTPADPTEAALQNILHLFSKTRLEQIRRVLNEVDQKALYKTQFRTLPFNTIHQLITIAVNLNENTNENNI